MNNTKICILFFIMFLPFQVIAGEHFGSFGLISFKESASRTTEVYDSNKIILENKESREGVFSRLTLDYFYIADRSNWGANIGLGRGLSFNALYSITNRGKLKLGFGSSVTDIEFEDPETGKLDSMSFPSFILGFTFSSWKSGMNYVDLSWHFARNSSKGEKSLSLDGKDYIVKDELDSSASLTIGVVF